MPALRGLAGRFNIITRTALRKDRRHIMKPFHTAAVMPNVSKMYGDRLSFIAVAIRALERFSPSAKPSPIKFTLSMIKSECVISPCNFDNTIPRPRNHSVVILACATSKDSPPSPNINRPKSMSGKVLVETPSAKIDEPMHTRDEKAPRVIFGPSLSTRMPPTSGRIMFGAEYTEYRRLSCHWNAS